MLAQEGRVSRFRGVVSDAGYEWAKGLQDGKPRLVPRFVPGVGYHAYELEQGVFLTFAALNPKEPAIQDFAGEYGDIFSVYEAEQGAAREDGTVAFGATLGTWTQKIADVRLLCDLWAQVRSKDAESLRGLILWSETEVGYKLKTPEGWHNATLAHTNLPGLSIDRYSRGDVVQPAYDALRREINLRLAEAPIVPEVRQRLTYRPPNLLAAMWLQLAEAVAGGFDFYSCDACGKFFQRGQGGRRTDATTCSNACRQRKNRSAN